MAARSTTREVASAAGVSLATVSLVLNKKPGVSAETRRRVVAAMERLGYQRRPAAAGTALTLGLLIERLPVPAFADPAVGLMVQGVESAAGQRGYHVLLATVEAGATDLPAMLTERQVDGLIVLGGGDIADDYIRLLVATGIPLVLADNFVDGLVVSCVLGDNVTGGYLITKHLLDLGHRRIAMLTGPRKYKTLTERLEGYQRAMDEAGIGRDPGLLVPPVHGAPRKGYTQTRTLLAGPRPLWPTAIFAVSDKTALGALEALKEAGLRVPDDMTLVAFDDIADSAHVTPALTTVRLPMQAIGAVAVGRLIELIQGVQTLPTKTLLYTELIVRASAAAPRQAAPA